MGEIDVIKGSCLGGAANCISAAIMSAVYICDIGIISDLYIPVSILNYASFRVAHSSMQRAICGKSLDGGGRSRSLDSLVLKQRGPLTEYWMAIC